MSKRGKRFRQLQSHFRKQRFRRVESLIREILRHKSGEERITILDAGGRGVYWEMLDPSLRPRVAITCLNFEAELSRYSSEFSGLQIENAAGDACAMPQYADDSFDLVHSNSVIEHVGSFQNMERFATEVSRVGRAYYVQTPNFWFPVEPHYAFPVIHWLPDQTRLWLFTRADLGYARKTDFKTALARIDHARMIGPAALRGLFPDARMERERLALLTKSITAVRPFPAA